MNKIRVLTFANQQFTISAFDPIDQNKVCKLVLAIVKNTSL